MTSLRSKSLQVRKDHIDTIRQIVLSGRPDEVCGFLAGVGGLVSDVIPVQNISKRPLTGFRMEPREQLKALIKIERLGCDLIAIYHSHPSGRPVEPSPLDLANAHYPDALMVIVVPDSSGQSVKLRAFALSDGMVSECPIVLAPDS